MACEFGIIEPIHKSGGALYQQPPPWPTTLEVADMRILRPIPHLSQVQLDRFWSKVDKSGGPDACWPWIGTRRAFGYGSVTINGMNYLTHRVSYFLATATDPIGKMVLHHCDNPPCCNPDHYFIGTQKDNRQDCMRKNRTATGDRNGTRLHPELVPRGESHGNAITTEDDVREMRRLHASGMPQTQIAKQFGISTTALNCIVLRKTWKHVA